MTRGLAVIALQTGLICSMNNSQKASPSDRLDEAGISGIRRYGEEAVRLSAFER